MSDIGHWYDRNTLELITQVPMATPTYKGVCVCGETWKLTKTKAKGTVLCPICGEQAEVEEKLFRDATVTDARKVGALCSVTTMIDEVKGKGMVLEKWIRDQLICAAIDFPYTGDPENEEERKVHARMLIAKANEKRDVTAERGTELHGMVYEFFTNNIRPADLVGAGICDRIAQQLEREGIDEVECEKVIGSAELGWAGATDLAGLRKGEVKLVDDLKTTSLKTFSGAYDKWKIQLGGYSIGLGDTPKLVSVVADRDGNCWGKDDYVRFIEHDEPEIWKGVFNNVLEIWVKTCCKGGYDPRKFTEEAV